MRVAVLAIFLLAAASLPSPPPAPSPQPVTETYFGVSVTDPYRFFENVKSPELAQFFKDQDAYTSSVLAGIPMREKLLSRIEYLDNLGTSVGPVDLVVNQYFYEQQKPGEATPRLYVRSAAGGRGRLLIDPDRFAAKAGEHQTIDFFVPSNSGRYVAFGISPNGSENDVTRVVRVADGKILPDAITRTRFGVTGWDLDDRSFFYNRLPQLPPNAPPIETQLRPVVYQHVLGANPERDRRVFGIGVNRGIAMTPTDIGEVSTTPGSPYLIAAIAHGVRNEITLYAEALGAFHAGRKAWRKLLDVDDDVTGLSVQGTQLFLLSHKDAPNFKIVSLDMSHPDIRHAKTVVPHGAQTVIEGLSAARDALYVQERTGGLGHVLRVLVSSDGRALRQGPVPMPYAGYVTSITTDLRVDGVTFGVAAWLHTLLYYATRANASVYDTKLKPPYPVSTAVYASREVKARSADGTLVPLSIIAAKDVKRDGSHPTYLEGYGAYGITLTPGLDPNRFVWLEHNGVYAICHPRGGGWYGDGWHRAGMLGNKQHTVQDFIACAHYLIDNGYTTSAHLAGEGTSAGGITIGDAIVQEPALFAAALAIDGVTDAVRAEFEPNGPANIPEFGSVKTRSGFTALYAMDAYLHIKDGTPYPAVFVNTGTNDPRVSPAEAAKFAARLQAATSSGKPVLLRVNTSEGHGLLGASREQTEQLISDEYSFLLWQLGDPSFQPR
ncbi:MAG: prolyl oligopeptidase family serine peptidase [Candidatus Eremiobacteraeota bacterium]|nr:prolyl oligopeptidase family serine peptidase [Candidatus Eremiobacteraeota bacterium]